jgi:protein-tyrosine phosphatase
MPVAMNFFRRLRTMTTTWTPNFSWITQELAVGGSFPSERAEELASAHRIRAVVDLRNEAKDDEAVLHRHGMTLLHLPTEDMCGVDAEQLDEGVAFASAALDRGERVLIHCEHGIGRSATLALCVMVFRGDRPLDALEQMKSRRALVSPSPAQFACWSEWLARHRELSRAPWEVPDFDAFQAIAYRHMRIR